jgi:CDP-glycerol glycerophosphotransferase (TagB/SpsB family)
MSKRKQVLFSGYAPVHFLCFLPVYEQLAHDDAVDVWLSGGFAVKDGGEKRYEIDGFYDPFPVDPDRVISFEQARQRDFDFVVCAHTSDALFPRKANRTVQIFHGVSFKNFAVREKVLKFDYLCVPGSYHARQFVKQGLIRPEASRALVTGFAKADRLVRPGFDRDSRLREIGVDPALPTILYAPTGGKKNSLETIGREVISAIDADQRWNLLVKPHDHPKKQIDWFSELAPFESERVRLVRDLDVIDYLQAADLLVTDASSVAVEYTLLDRPIVFIDVPKLLENAVKRGAPIDLSTYGRKIGSLARDSGEVVDAIAGAFDHPQREGEVRRAMARDVFRDPGRATERVTDVVRHAAGLLDQLSRDIEEIRP